MSDSQKWSSYDDSEAPKCPSVTAEQAVDAHIAGKSDRKSSTGWSALVEPAVLRNMRNRLMFGSLVGFVTGATFGGIDGAKLYVKQHGKQPSTAALSFVARGAAVTGGVFSGFFFLYCGIKTALATQREDDLISVGISTVAAGLPFARSTVMKQNLPYAVMLVALDHFHEELSEFRK